ncbi:hypothetical protein HDV62DRAFT_31382 [Trichoderma sp. SZMC 28011]
MMDKRSIRHCSTWGDEVEGCTRYRDRGRDEDIKQPRAASARYVYRRVLGRSGAYFAGTDRVRRVEIDPLRIALGPPILCYVGCVGEWPDWCDWTGGGLSQGGNWTDADRWRCESRILVCGRRGSNMERGVVSSSSYCIDLEEQGWCW